MEKSLNRAAAVTKSASSTWLAFTVTGLCGGLIGATATYLALRPKLSVTPIAAASLAKTAADPLAYLPPPELTAGQAPAQAERTLGNFYYDHQNWPAAIRSYQAAIQQGSDDADIRTDLGNAYRFSQRPDDALVQYQLAQKMNPAHEFSLFNQGGSIWKICINHKKPLPLGGNIYAASLLVKMPPTPSNGWLKQKASWHNHSLVPRPTRRPPIKQTWISSSDSCHLRVSPNSNSPPPPLCL